MAQNQTISEIKDSGAKKEHNFEGSFRNNKKKELLISVIIPLYNEENTIKKVIKKIPNHQRYEIIIVNDGSTDNSVEKIKEIKDRDIKIINHEFNQGYGAAILTGFKHTKGDIIVTIDSDGQHNPQEISNLIKPIINNQADIVVGSRYLGKYHYKNPLHARMGAYFINIFLRILFLQQVYDNQCGFRAIRKECTRRFRNMKYTGMGFSTEMLFKAAFYKYKIVETPISVDPREFGASYVNLISILRSIISCIIYYTLRKFNLDVNRLILKRAVNYFYKKVKNNRIFSK